MIMARDFSSLPVATLSADSVRQHGQKSETRMTARVLKQDPNTFKFQNNTYILFIIVCLCPNKRSFEPLTCLPHVQLCSRPETICTDMLER